MNEEEDTVIISREIIPGGRSTVKINGRNVSLGQLRSIISTLLDMHLQHEHLSIFKPSLYLQYLDGFIEGQEQLLKELGEIYKRLSQQREQLNNIRQNEAHKLQQIDFLNYQIQEIEKAGLYPGEEEELSSLRYRVRNAQRLLEGSTRMLDLINGSDSSPGAIDLIAAAMDSSTSLKDESVFIGLKNQLEEIYYSLQDISSSISMYSRGLDFEPGRLDEIEERLYEIKRLKNKYGQDINAILEFAQKSRLELEHLTHSQEIQDQLEKDLAVSEREYLDLARRISSLRHQAAWNMEKRVKTELTQLNLPHLQFQVVVSPSEKWTARGIDQVDFLFSANPGETPRPMEKIASGGEISRFVLALKSALADIYKVPTLIFDEIDAGVGGSALNAMARKLVELSRSHQIILVTHAPQVASLATVHYTVEKEAAEQSTLTRTRRLNQQERVEEIARMLGGEHYSEITFAHAREMLRAAIHGE
ncbi:DNA repair protein RecN [Syntrophomonas palmitatica]|uniref:DNA repair protein RecN n=1 Tax=Syntrophomonas palmitatica TaxID=402877 RepID=UPI0006D25A4A|nr:DNA repair protein RecN [Syntrophomonas palmitatica]